MSNLLKMVSGMMSDGMVGKMASLVGSNSSVVKTALTSLMPSLLKGIASKGATESGASSLLSMIKDHALGGDMTSSLSGGGASDELLEKGSKLNESIFGSSLKDIAVPGLAGDAKSKLMNLATPMMLGSIGKVASTQNLDASGLSSYLQKQVSGGTTGSITGAASSATSAAGSVASKATSTATRAASSATTAVTDTASSGLGFLKWAFPLLLVLGGAWYFLSGDSGTTTTQEAPAAPAKATTTKATHTHADGTVHEGHSHGTATKTTTNATTTGTSIKGNINDATGKAGNMIDGAKDKAGNIIDGAKDKAGNMIDAAKGAAGDAAGAASGAAGSLKDAAGKAGSNLKDAAGNAAGAAGDAATKAGGNIKDAAVKAGGAVKGAAGDVKGAAEGAAKKIGGK